MEPMLLLMVAAFAAVVGAFSLLRDRVDMEEIAKVSARQDAGALRTAGIVGALLTVLTLIIIVFLLAGVADPFFNATENITQAIANASTGNATIDALLGPFSLLVAAVLVVAFVKQVTDRV